MDSLYKKVDNLVNKEICEVLGGGMLLREMLLPISRQTAGDKPERLGHWGDTVPGAFCSYGWDALDSLLFYLLPRMEQETGKKLLPTYTFSRVYRYGHVLRKHKDRPSCEYSVTLTLKTDGTPWPIYMDEVPVEIEQGSGVIYKGCDIHHRRDPYEGDEHVQAFLHYVDADGPHAEYYLDGINNPCRLDMDNPFC